jgi:uncharacterized protein DUF4129
VRANGAIALLVGARCFVEAVTFTAAAAVAHAAASGREPMPVLPTTLILFGAGLLLVTIMREAGSERRSSLILVIALAASVAWGLSLPARDADGFGVLSRIVMFGLLGEAYLWRLVSIARGALRWTDARNAVPIAGLAIAVAVLGPGTVDRSPFAALSLLVVAAAGLALSLARTTEELALSRGTSGKLRTSSATSATVIVAIVAILAAALVPSVQDALAAFGGFLAPIVGRVFFLLILPFAYLAGYLVEFLRPIVSGRLPQLPVASFDPAQDEAMRREIEAARPFVFGGVELVIVAIAVLVALVLLERMLRERRLDLPEGVTLEREHADGISLRAALGALRPRRAAKRRRPRDDGSPAAAIRSLYWRFLELAESRGAGWREGGETPAEHQERIAKVAPVWGAAAPLVRAFEDVRYGEIAPDATVVGGASAVLRTLEAGTRRS